MVSPTIGVVSAKEGAACSPHGAVSSTRGAGSANYGGIGDVKTRDQ
jgi:hypothetical protein